MVGRCLRVNGGKQRQTAGRSWTKAHCNVKLWIVDNGSVCDDLMASPLQSIASTSPVCV